MKKKETKELTSEEVKTYVEKYNHQIAGAPMSFILYRELLGIFWYLTMNKRFRDIFKTLIDHIDNKQISSFNELLSLFDGETVQNVYDEGLIDDLFKLKIIEDDNE